MRFDIPHVASVHDAINQAQDRARLLAGNESLGFQIKSIECFDETYNYAGKRETFSAFADVEFEYDII